MNLDPQQVRMAEALLFAATEPLDEATLARRLPEGTDVSAVLDGLRQQYAGRGVSLNNVAGRWAFHTAPDLSHLLQERKDVPRRLSRAGIETLAIIAYHQPITRAEIEAIRGVSLGQGTLDMLIETGWVRMRGRRRSPGRPLTYGTTEEFMIHFGLASLDDLPGLAELKTAGLLEIQPTAGGLPLPGESPGGEADEDLLSDSGLSNLDPNEGAGAAARSDDDSPPPG
jgi:segregation and condensation protein B